MQIVNPVFRFRGLWLLVGYILVAVIVYLSLTSEPVQMDLGFAMQDKFFHMLAYFSLMGWFAQIYHVPKQRVIFALLFIALGVLMEYIQSLNPARYFEFEDMVANTLGVAIAVLLAKRTSFRYMLQAFERWVP